MEPVQKEVVFSWFEDEKNIIVEVDVVVHITDVNYKEMACIIV